MTSIQNHFLISLVRNSFKRKNIINFKEDNPSSDWLYTNTDGEMHQKAKIKSLEYFQEPQQQKWVAYVTRGKIII